MSRSSGALGDDGEQSKGDSAWWVLVVAACNDLHCSTLDNIVQCCKIWSMKAYLPVLGVGLFLGLARRPLAPWSMAWVTAWGASDSAT